MGHGVSVDLVVLDAGISVSKVLNFVHEEPAVNGRNEEEVTVKGKQWTWVILHGGGGQRKQGCGPIGSLQGLWGYV